MNCYRFYIHSEGCQKGRVALEVEKKGARYGKKEKRPDPNRVGVAAAIRDQVNVLLSRLREGKGTITSVQRGKKERRVCTRSGNGKTRSPRLKNAAHLVGRSITNLKGQVRKKKEKESNRDRGKKKVQPVWTK